MRLRRETGDFQITINSENAVNTIRKGLSAEDFVGELVNVNGTYEVVNSANDTETGAEFKTNSFTLTYTKATGVITAEEGGSGSGSGGGDRIEIMAHGDSETVDPLPTGLTVSDFKDAVILIDFDDIVAMCHRPNYIQYVDNMHIYIQSDHWSPDSGEAEEMDTIVLEYNPDTGEVTILGVQGGVDPGDS